MNMYGWHELLTPIWLSLKISLIASVLVFLIGIALAWFMSQRTFRGKVWLETIFLLPLVLPPSVVGFLLLVLLGRKGWLGVFFDKLFHLSFLFTWQAGVLASVVVAFPLVYQTMKVGFGSVDKELLDAARSQGANNWQLLKLLVLPLSMRALASAYMLGFARGLGEFGATIMIAGNIPGKTQTIPTAIYAAVDAGKMQQAWIWSISIVMISFLMLWLVNRKP
jgi:molybdate transport system permease protein